MEVVRLVSQLCLNYRCGIAHMWLFLMKAVFGKDVGHNGAGKAGSDHEDWTRRLLRHPCLTIGSGLFENARNLKISWEFNKIGDSRWYAQALRGRRENKSIGMALWIQDKGYNYMGRGTKLNFSGRRPVRSGNHHNQELEDPWLAWSLLSHILWPDHRAGGQDLVGLKTQGH